MSDPVHFASATALAPVEPGSERALAPRHALAPAEVRRPDADALTAEVVLVTHNSERELASSLPAIHQAASVAGAPLLFVDLGSSDGTRSLAASHAPGARGIWLTEHDRLIDALAAAAACSSADVLVVLNPTAEPGSPDALARLAEHLDDHPYASIAAPALRARTGEVLRSTRPISPPARRAREYSRVEWVLDVAFAIRRSDAEDVIRSAERLGRSLDELSVCLSLRSRGLEVHYVPSIEVIDAGGQAAESADAPAVASLEAWRVLLRHPGYARRLSGRRPIARKLARAATRALELAVTVALLTILAPLMLAIVIAIRLDSPGPALFRQVRLGRGARPFRMYKFRTMRYDADPAPHEHFVRDMIMGRLRSDRDADTPQIFKLHPDPRVTRVGRLLRRTSLDELPQLVNVLRGEMNLVGFRPPIPYEVADYPAWYHRRFDGKPGITGLWQVSGRNELGYEEMVRLDIEYLNRRSWLFDVWLLVRTVGVVLLGRGAV